jgi:hypothetical protein
MEMTIEKINYSIYGGCRKVSNGTVDVIVTTDVGPRIIFYGFTGGENMFAELRKDVAVQHDWGEWRPWGGHRFWHAPEVLPRSYVPDNDPVEAETIGENALRVAPGLEARTAIQKEMLVKLDADGTQVTVTHTLTNKGVWPVQIAPWGLTIMRPGGTTIIPQEEFVSHDDCLLPARPLVLWHFTDMSDPRWTWGEKYIRLRTDSTIASKPQKAGVGNKRGWAAYLRDETLFIKRFDYCDNAKYPDLGCNCETYTDGDFMEVETLGPLVTLEPGESTTHVERWALFGDVKAGETEESLDEALRCFGI